MQEIGLKKKFSILRLPTNSVRIFKCCNAKATIVKPHINRIGSCLNSTFKDFNNLVNSAQACLVISILHPVTIAQRKLHQEGVIHQTYFLYVILYLQKELYKVTLKHYKATVTECYKDETMKHITAWNLNSHEMYSQSLIGV